MEIHTIFCIPKEDVWYLTSKKIRDERIRNEEIWLLSSMTYLMSILLNKDDKMLKLNY